MIEKNFSKDYEDLNGIINWFRKGEYDLDEALTKYKEGVELIRSCKQRLQEVENEFRKIEGENKPKEQKVQLESDDKNKL